MEKTYLFYDIETTGLNKSFDQVVQFAAIRTDLAFNEQERHEFFVKLNPDVIPAPKAFITHRISLTKLENGLDEFNAMKKIHALFNTPGTISLGYNSLGFDDEFLRFSFYRNLLAPYTHQYANDCSRMDLYPITLMYFLFKNNLLKWPEDNLKLENISRINGFAEGMAHNALVDVLATLNLARCLSQDTKTWEYLTGFFNKNIDLERCYQISNDSMGIIIDGKFGHAQDYQGVVVPLGMHHHYKNQFIWLRIDNEKILEATSEDFLTHTWVVNKKLGEPAWILPMKDRFLQPYLRGKQNEIKHTISWLQKNPNLVDKISNHYRNFTYPVIPNIDVDAGLYEKGFLSFNDMEICKKIHLAPPERKMSFLSSLSQNHLQEILIRIVGRHFPEYLADNEKEFFERYLEKIKFSSDENSFLDYRGAHKFTRTDALNEIASLKTNQLDHEQQQILNELERYITNI